MRIFKTTNIFTVCIFCVGSFLLNVFFTFQLIAPLFMFIGYVYGKWYWLFLLIIWLFIEMKLCNIMRRRLNAKIKNKEAMIIFIVLLITGVIELKFHKELNLFTQGFFSLLLVHYLFYLDTLTGAITKMISNFIEKWY